MRGWNSAAGTSLPLLTQWKACLVAGFLFCGCLWWGARADSSSSEELRELGGTCPDLPLAPSAPSWIKGPYLWSLSPISQGLQLCSSLGLGLEGTGDRGQTASGLVEFGLMPLPSQCFLSQSLRRLKIYRHPLCLLRV